MSRLFGLAAAAVVLCGCVGGERATRVRLALDDAHAFVGLVDAPRRPRGAGVLLLGGGHAHDAAWSVPGSVMVEGRRVPLTISGEAHEDAPPLAAALTAQGFVVLRASTVPLGAGDAVPLGFEDSVALAAEALAALRETPGVERVYIVGHSLGATRAALIADERVSGIVCLAGAYLSRAARPPRELAADALASPGALARGVDLDGDGVVRGWEAAAAVLEENDRAEFRPGTAWAIDRLRELGVPVLALFGGLDPISVHGPSLARLPRAEVVYLAGLGHTLGEEAPGEGWARVGPMSREAVERTTHWLAALEESRSPSPPS